MRSKVSSMLAFNAALEVPLFYPHTDFCDELFIHNFLLLLKVADPDALATALSDLPEELEDVRRPGSSDLLDPSRFGAMPNELSWLHFAVQNPAGASSEARSACVTALLTAGIGKVDETGKHGTYCFPEDQLIEPRSGLTCVHQWAASNREIPMLRELLEAGAACGEPDAEGDPPLFTLIYSLRDPHRPKPTVGGDNDFCFEDALELLLAGGASLEARDAAGRDICEAARLANERRKEGVEEDLTAIIASLDHCAQTWGQTYFADIHNNTKYRDLPRELE